MKQKNSKTEYSEVWDAGTYQTGNTTPPKNGNPVVTVLLILVIFLGGIASAMGIINLRLLAALNAQKPQQTVPILLQPNPSSPQQDDSHLQTEPSIPQATISMDLQDQLSKEETIPDNDVEAVAAASRVTVQVSETESCSGLVLSADGHILTYAHLVCDAERILVKLLDGSTHRAALVGYDAYSDLAVIYIRASGLTPANFSTGRELASGSKVNAFCGNGCTGGTVFAADKALEVGSLQLPLLKTSAATGDATGSLWNSNGQVVGIISPRIGRFLQADDKDTAYVIPSVTVKNIVDQLLRRGFVSGRPSLGAKVEEVNNVHQNYWHLPSGLRITHCVNSALQDGDILISINGREVKSSDTLYEILFSCRVGQTVEAVVYRDGRTVSVTLSLNEEQGLR